MSFELNMIMPAYPELSEYLDAQEEQPDLREKALQSIERAYGGGGGIRDRAEGFD